MGKKQYTLDLEKAKSLLSDASLKIKDIAPQLGFRTGVQLSIAFKRATGMGISEYRVEHGIKAPHVFVKNTAPIWMLKAQKQLQTTSLSVSAIAQLAGYGHRNTFYSTYQKLFGLTPGEEKKQARARRAIELVTKTDIALSKIYIDCGLTDNSAFYTFFKKTTGLTPGDYRKQFGITAHNKPTKKEESNALIRKIITLTIACPSLDTVAIRTGFGNKAALEKYYTKETGKNLEEERNNLRFSRIQKYLRRTDLEPEQFMDRVGITSPRYMKFFFIEMAGMPMEEYRASHKVNKNLPQPLAATLSP